MTAKVRRGEPVVSLDVGTGPPLILLHGLAGSAHWWARNTPTLAPSFRVIAIDLPGFGASPRGERLVLDEAAGQLAASMDRLAIERASVIGHSMGGLIAAALAADHPERVDRLVLVDAAFLTLGPDPLAPLKGSAATLRWTAPSLLPRLAMDGFRAGPLRLADATLQLLAADWRHKLPGITAPTLVVWGEHDSICPIAIGREIVSLVAEARLFVVEGAGHNPMWEQPQVFGREVLSFLTS